MLLQEINIVSFNVPNPANYGGVIDVFYKIKALSKLGIKIHLHCFQYGRKEAKDLDNYCTTVHYYERKLRFWDFLSIKPFIVQSRNNERLLNNLISNNYPILFEGLHSCYYLSHPQIQDRIKFVRAHNIEHDYYFALANQEKNIFKRIYFYAEAVKLKTFEKELLASNQILAISENDFKYFSSKYKNTISIPAFHNNFDLQNKTGRGNYILFHGNLGVNENEKALMFLIENVFSKIKHVVKIAGKNPSKRIRKISENSKNIELFADISDEQMLDLVRNAQIIVLYSFQVSGVKLKLLNSLYQGRFCIANDKILSGSGLEASCILANSETEIIGAIKQYYLKEFTDTERKQRQIHLQNKYSNEENAQKIVDILY